MYEGWKAKPLHISLYNRQLGRSLLQRFVKVASDYAVQYLLKVSQYLDGKIKVNSTTSFARDSSVTRL